MVRSNYTKILRNILNLKKSPPFQIKSSGNIECGIMTFHNGNFEVKGDQKVKIGNYCAIGKNVSIITSNHDYNFTCIQGTFYRHYFNIHHPGVTRMPPSKERTKGGVTIGSDVWIADNVTILSGITIGNGVCIANNSVVTKDIPSYTIIGGIPAKVLKKRFSPEMIIFMESLNWWDWDEKKIRSNKRFFTANINEEELSELEKLIIQ